MEPGEKKPDDPAGSTTSAGEPSPPSEASTKEVVDPSPAFEARPEDPIPSEQDPAVSERSIPPSDDSPEPSDSGESRSPGEERPTSARPDSDSPLLPSPSTFRDRFAPKKKKPISPLVILAAGAATAAAIGVPLKLWSDHAASVETEEEPAPSVRDAEADTAPPSAKEEPDAAVPVVEPSAVRPRNWRVRELEGDSSVELKSAKMGKRPFSLALTQAGATRGDVQHLVHLLRPIIDVDHTTPDDAFTMALDKKSKHLVAFEYSLGPTDVVQAREEDGKLAAKKLVLSLEKKPLGRELGIDSDVKAAIEKGGFRSDLYARLETALEGHARLAEIHGGSLLRLVGEELWVDDRFDSYGELRGVEVVLPKRAKGERFYRYQGHATRGYFDASGKQPVGGGWRSPIPFARISSRFNPRRTHPVLKIVMPHNGVDFAAPPGTPVYSTGPGVLRFVGDSGPCGNMVHVLHENGLISAYCHLSRFAPGLVVGNKVAARDLLGYVGQTGRATGPHLHFAIKRGEGFIDPLSLKLDRVKIVPEGEMAEFERARHEIDVALDALHQGGADAGVDDDDEILDEVPDGGAP